MRLPTARNAPQRAPSPDTPQAPPCHRTGLFSIRTPTSRAREGAALTTSQPPTLLPPQLADTSPSPATRPSPTQSYAPPAPPQPITAATGTPISSLPPHHASPNTAPLHSNQYAGTSLTPTIQQPRPKPNAPKQQNGTESGFCPVHTLVSVRGNARSTTIC